MREAKLIRKAAVLADHKQGITVKALAKKYHISETAVRNYLKEDRAKTTPEAAAQEAQKRKRKQERDNERRCTVQERQARSQARKEKVKAYLDAGMTAKEAAEKEGLSYGTVTDYIRGENIPTDITYKDTIRIGQYKKELLEWAKKKSGGTIKTPEGKMTLLRVYPHIVECAKQCAKGYIITTFTLAEVYYINQGG